MSFSVKFRTIKKLTSSFPLVANRNNPLIKILQRLTKWKISLMRFWLDLWRKRLRWPRLSTSQKSKQIKLSLQNLIYFTTLKAMIKDRCLFIRNNSPMIKERLFPMIKERSFPMNKENYHNLLPLTKTQIIKVMMKSLFHHWELILCMRFLRLNKNKI